MYIYFKGIKTFRCGTFLQPLRLLYFKGFAKGFGYGHYGNGSFSLVDIEKYPNYKSTNVYEDAIKSCWILQKKCRRNRLKLAIKKERRITRQKKWQVKVH